MTNVALNRDQVWQAIDAQRTGLSDLLEDLSDEEWRHPTLCSRWTVRDVATHLMLQQLGLTDVLAMMLRWRGSVDRMLCDAVRRHAESVSTGQIIAGIRGMAGSTRHTVGVTYREPLIDLLVHTQDIAIPLNRRRDMSADAAATAASRVLSMRWPRPLPAVRKVAGFRLTASDIDWSAGDGPEVHGPMAALLLTCTGRLAALQHLSGPGAEALTARLTTPE